MKKICHISSVHNALDSRIFLKECNSLSKFGFDVTLVAIHPNDETINDIRIIGIRPINNRFLRVFLNPIKAFFKALNSKAEVFHLHDPELIPIGILFKILNKKVIFDMHELVYHQIEDKIWINKNFRNLFKKAYQFIEKLGIKYFDHIIIAESGYQEYFNENYSKYLKKITQVRNFSQLSLIESTKKEEISDELSIVYVGGLTRLRGIKECILAMSKVENCKLILLGRFDEDIYQEECTSLPEWDSKVIYLGYQSQAVVYQYIQRSIAGLSVLYPCKNYLTSLPVKSFEYMSLSKPLIMSDFPYWKEFYKDCALFVNPNNIDDISQKINELITNNNLRNALGENGFQLIKTKFNWENESKNLYKVYSNL